MLSKSAVLLLAAIALAAPPPRHLKWGDLERLARGRVIALELPSGIKLQGEAIAFQEDQLVLDVRKTSDKHAYPKGRGVVPRPEVQRLRVVKTGNTWKAGGTAIGAGVGALVAIPVTRYMNNEGGANAGITAALIAAPAAIGYLAGRSADHTMMEIVVDPD